MASDDDNPMNCEVCKAQIRRYGPGKIGSGYDKYARL